MRYSEERALHDTRDDPRAAAGTKEHGDALHKESAKREFLIKARADKCIEDAKNRKFQISLHIFELAQIAAMARSDRANAAALLPRAILVSARSPIS